ncbi:hypothetical protein POM88_023494 [Heracleum sosnowskyi]|uniref:Uncharacterized protein n=1 Tax=Heracleum sosnowskyi TaxID=360622 RepID=A0AAD8MUN2_9APIA|nr:hypothetical protein POM88_023494 [Heracleum sosnowskyi]
MDLLDQLPFCLTSHSLIWISKITTLAVSFQRCLNLLRTYGILIIDLSVFFVVDRIQHRGRRLRHLEGNHSSWQSLPVSTAIEFSSTAPEDSSEVSTISSPPLINPKYLRPLRTRTMRISRRSFSRKSRIPIGTKICSVAELQAATDFFSEQPKQFGSFCSINLNNLVPFVLST